MFVILSRRIASEREGDSESLTNHKKTHVISKAFLKTLLIILPNKYEWKHTVALNTIHKGFWKMAYFYCIYLFIYFGWLDSVDPDQFKMFIL